MTSEAPDPKAFTSWEEAFQFPLPAVRAMERQLRRDIESNKEKLRSLVGASYRDLLGTAETVIEMDANMHKIEAYIGEIGRRCNTRILERKEQNVNDLEEEVGSSAEQARSILASQLAVLRSCPDVISRILRDRGSLLLAAKVLVVSRLLHTKLSKKSVPIPFLERLRNRLSALRRRMLARIDRRFKDLDSSSDSLIEAMSAFALATSSSPADVSKHFLYIRSKEISECFEGKDSKRRSMSKGLRLHVTTIRDTRALIPGQLANALSRLKRIPILKGQDICDLPELNLDIHQHLLGEDIVAFTPYVRHDDLSVKVSEELLRDWGRSSMKTYLDGLQTRIEDLVDPLDVVHLRKEILELWLSQRSGPDSANVASTLDDLRRVFVHRLSKIIQVCTSSLSEIGHVTDRILTNWESGAEYAPPLLWDLPNKNLNLAHGAKQLRQDIMDGLSGKGQRLSEVYGKYELWQQSVMLLNDMILQMRDTKWDDFEDDYNSDDDDSLDNKNVLLSEDDPRALQELLSESLAQAYDDLQKSLGLELLGYTKKAISGPEAVFLLRVWKGIRRNAPSGVQVGTLGVSSIPLLHEAISIEALQLPMESCSKRLARATQSKKLIIRSLWEGNPDLPVFPSLWAYRLLLDIENAMTDLGTEIWTPNLTDVLKQHLSEQLFQVLERAETEKEGPHSPLVLDGHVNGAPEADSKEDIQKPEDQPEELRNDNKNDEDQQAPVETSDGVNGTAINGDTSKPDKPVKPPPAPAPPAAETAAVISPDDENLELQRDRLTQRLFDLLYITSATITADTTDVTSDIGFSSNAQEGIPTSTGKASNSLADAIQSLENKTELDAKALERLRKGATEYWKRTRLLAGLL